MTIRVVNDRDYWQEVLTDGGFTSVPRWVREPVDEVAAHNTAIGDDLVAALRRLAEGVEVRVEAVVLAAHARILATLAGEAEVVTGYVASPGVDPVPLRLSTERESWDGLLRHTARAESALLEHAGFPVDDLRRDLELVDPAFETVFDATGIGGEVPEHTVLWVTVSLAGAGRLELRYRSDALDDAAASRIAGYYLTALRSMVADPTVDPRTVSLLGPDELHFQLEGLAGSQRELPDRRLHELFEQRVDTHPDVVAAVLGQQEWTYAELNARANRIGRALLSRRLQREDVVAVVTERNLDWMAAVLAIFKAGGVYLPIEPHFPSDRIATTLSRADCRLVVTEASSRESLDGAIASLPDIDTVLVDGAYDEDHADDNLDVEVAAEQLAYIYFTSGSTGQPKGAMCEHGGMLNHLFAKIDDLEIGDGQVVAQIAPQCFDISLWQLVSALLVGGRTHLIAQETILEPERFVDEIIRGEVAVMQVVPSYLEVLLSFLEQSPHELPNLHCVSVTGEALSLELAERWFAAKPAIKLANAYGLTETSDDTNHEVMDRPPARGGVPLGAAVNNVRVYVVDENLAPVPLGAPGEIVFSGVCVGRGYINDPDRTRLAYMEDPYHPGERLYRSGDFGRWRPDGKLEFLGRRDAQVKIRGFRIEIGEIENALMGIDGVKQGAVVVTGDDRSKQLVGFYSGVPRDPSDVADALSRSLPDYMVPAAFKWQESLPLTDNGKVDRKTLTAAAARFDEVAETAEPPSTEAERHVAAMWAKVLGLPEDRITRRDNFFDLGGTSLSAVELVISLERAVTLKDVTNNPVLCDLADQLGGATASHSGLLQLLAGPGDAEAGALICFPYAGGNAINFQPLARALRETGPAVYAVELPGHDLTSSVEAFRPLEEVVDQVVSEIVSMEPDRLLLWGHSSGTAFALAVARRLEDAGVHVEHVFLAAQLLGSVDERLAHMEQLHRRSDDELAALLRAGSGHAAVDGLDSAHAGAAYRHDCLSAHRYLLDELSSPPSERLSTPVTVLVAADDPSTVGWEQREHDWQLLAGDVSWRSLVSGGHYFLRSRATEVVEILTSVAATVRTRPS